MWKTSLGVGLSLFLALALPVESKKECFADLNGPKDDPNNIYKCADSEKCCQEGGEPTCCREKDTDVAIWDQVKLWGTLSVMILVLALVMWYCRHDGDCCGNKKGQEDHGCIWRCCGKKKKGPEPEQVKMPESPSKGVLPPYSDIDFEQA
ncbi:uncharacterized protein [Penaeus vannamei]|uniref:uncharacterized protein isoform X1 n=1 Tax=Penaeus vannamei TaxID=6689 RepID=UPI00387FA2CC